MAMTDEERVARGTKALLTLGQARMLHHLTTELLRTARELVEVAADAHADADMSATVQRHAQTVAKQHVDVTELEQQIASIQAQVDAFVNSGSPLSPPPTAPQPVPVVEPAPPPS